MAQPTRCSAGDHDASDWLVGQIVPHCLLLLYCCWRL